MIEEMKNYFKANDLKYKKLTENTEINKEELKRLKISLQDYEKSSTITKEKLSRIKDDCESKFQFFLIFR